jgi:hypothetical protein
MTHPRRTVTGMRRALLAALAVACVASATAGGRAVATQTWVTTVCQSLGPWRAQIATLNATIQTDMASAKTPRDSRTHLLSLLGGAERATGTARTGVSGAGDPDVLGGAEIERRFVAALTGIRDAYHRADRTITDLPVTDAKVAACN